MILSTLHVQAFRSHTDTRVRFAPGVNVIYGPNGAGKTNLLEAVHFLCLSKSFLASRDTFALQEGAPFFEVDGTFVSDADRRISARLVFVPAEGKRLFVNRAPLERLSEVVGQFPVVIFSPEDYALTTAGPDERRRFMDNIMSQARPRHMADLVAYRQTVRQRNELLSQYGRSRSARELPDALASWTAELVDLGARIVAARARFIDAFLPYLTRAFEGLQTVGLEPSMRYQTVGGLHRAGDAAAIRTRFEERLSENRARERETGRTVAGPHLDEIVFSLSGRELRRYASQGQHRTFGMALKLAQLYYLKERTGETPLLLLDEAFGSLDPTRTALLLALLQTEEAGQTILTTTHLEPFESLLDFGSGRNAAVEVRNGAVAEATL